MAAELNGGPVDLDRLQALALTNYGHFTTMRVEDGRVRGLTLHLERLARDCRAVFGTELDTERVREFARRVAPADGAVVVRVTVFDPALDVVHVGDDAEPHVLVTSRPAGSLAVSAMRTRSVAFVRDFPEIKNVGLFASLRHRRDAQRAGFDDALFVDRDGLVAEGSTWNIGFVRGDDVVWPDAAALAGTTMELLRTVHACTVEPVPLSGLAGFDAAFATNVAVGVRPITGIDDTTFPDEHPVIDVLRAAYEAVPGEPL